MTLGVFGLFIIFKDKINVDDSTLLAMAGILFAVAWQAFGTVWFKAVKTVETSALSTTVGGVCVATPLFLLTWLTFDRQIPSELAMHTASSIAYLGIIGSVFGMMLFYYALKKIDAAKISLITLITPIIALILGAWANGEQINQSIVIGTVMILSGIILFQWSSMRYLFVTNK